MNTYADGLRDGFHEAAKALESRATTIEQVERASMKPQRLYYSAEVNTLRAAAAMLRSMHPLTAPDPSPSAAVEQPTKEQP